MMKNSHYWLRKLYPFFLAVIGFNIIRLITDIPIADAFWPGSFRQHLMALGMTTLCYYLFDYLTGLSLRKRWLVRKTRWAGVREYGIVMLYLLVSTNLILYMGEWTGVFYMGDRIRDYIFANVVNILILIFYYTFIKQTWIEAEYREQSLLLLKAQYHPHFLFNALNTVYFQIDAENVTARKSIEQLSDLLRYQLYDVNRAVTLEQEINYLTTYIEFQKLRMPDGLDLQFELNVPARHLKIHALLFQPLLENAFKYVGGEYRIDVTLKQHANKVVFIIVNSMPAVETAHPEKGGIGLTNLRRRLELLYPGKYVLKTGQEENLFHVFLSLELF